MVLLEFNGNNTVSLEIKVKPANIFFKALLLFIAIFPIAAMLVVLATTTIESPFGFFIGFLLFSLCSLYIFRLFLWNSYGREIYSINGNEITSYNDYGLMKDNQQVRRFADLQLCYSRQDNLQNIYDLHNDTLLPEKNDDLYLIQFIIDEEVVSSVVPLQHHGLEVLAKSSDRINRRYPEITFTMN